MDLFDPMPATVPQEDLLNVGRDAFLKKSIVSFTLKQYIESLVHDRQARAAGDVGLGSVSTLVSNVSHTTRSNASPTHPHHHHNHHHQLNRQDSLTSRKSAVSHQASHGYY